MILHSSSSKNFLPRVSKGLIENYPEGMMVTCISKSNNPLEYWFFLPEAADLGKDYFIDNKTHRDIIWNHRSKRMDLEDERNTKGRIVYNKWDSLMD